MHNQNARNQNRKKLLDGRELASLIIPENLLFASKKLQHGVFRVIKGCGRILIGSSYNTPEYFRPQGAR